MNSNLTHDMFKLSGCYVEITSACNLRCIHCYNESGSDSYELTGDDFLKMLDGISDFENFDLTISGGEPLASKHFWEIISICKKLGVSNILVITNATLINSDIANKIKDLDINLQISLNGSNSQIHDKVCGDNSFNKTYTGIQNLIQVGVGNRIVCRNTINKCNIDDLRDYIKFVSNLGIENISFGSLKIQGRSVFNKDSIYLEHEEYRLAIETLNLLKEEFSSMNIDVPELYSMGCPYMFPDEDTEKNDCIPRIDSKGFIYLCQLAAGENNRIGNIRNKSLINTIASDDFNMTLNRLKKIQNEVKECDRCVWKDFCGRGCIALSIMTGENKTEAWHYWK